MKHASNGVVITTIGNSSTGLLLLGCGAVKRVTSASLIMQERRRDVLSVLECKHEPQLVVDTATANWQVLHASAAAREMIEGLAEDPPLGALWDMFAAAPENEVRTVEPLLSCFCILLFFCPITTYIGAPPAPP